MSDYEKLCLKCGHVWDAPTKRCPECDSVSWEIRSLRIREKMPEREPLQTPLPGSSQHYTAPESAVEFPPSWSSAKLPPDSDLPVKVAGRQTLTCAEGHIWEAYLGSDCPECTKAKEEAMSGEPTEAEWLAAHLKAVIDPTHGEPLYDIRFENGVSLTKEQVERIIQELLGPSSPVARREAHETRWSRLAVTLTAMENSGELLRLMAEIEDEVPVGVEQAEPVGWIDGSDLQRLQSRDVSNITVYAKPLSKRVLTAVFLARPPATDERWAGVAREITLIPISGLTLHSYREKVLGIIAREALASTQEENG